MRLFTTRDESAGYIVREDRNLNLQEVFLITDFTNLELEEIVNLSVGQKSNFDGISVERSQ